MFDFLKMFAQALAEKFTARFGSEFQWPTNFNWPPEGGNDSGHQHNHHHQHDDHDPQKVFSFHHFPDLHL